MTPQLQSIFQQAFAYTQQANYSQAKLLFDYVLKMQPKNFDALHAMGFISGVENNHQDAFNYLLRALKIKPNDPEINFNCAKALQELGKFLESLKYYQKAITLSPDNQNVWLGSGKLLQSLHRYDEAIANYDKALSLNPDFVAAWSNKGDTLNELKRYEEAIAHFDKALSLNPDFAAAWSNKGMALCELKCYDEAVAHFDKALSLNPDFAAAWSNKGHALSKLKQYDEAITHYNKALSLKPDYYEAWFNAGSTLHEIKRYEEAIAHYNKALSLKPDYQEAWFSKSVLNLFLKQYHFGWESYDWRLKTKDFQLRMAIKDLSLWNGSHCKQLLIFSEQGVGDIIFYASMIKIARKKVDGITISVDGRLLPILSRSFPEITFIDENVPLDASLYDAQIPFGSLPVILNASPNMDGRTVPYLIDNDALTKTLHHKLHPKKSLKCGVAWKSNNEKLGQNKSMSLADLNDIFKIDDYEFINLQYGDTQKEIKDLENNFGVKLTTIEDIDLFKNIDGLLSIIKTCDLIVTTSNVTAHLAGALGKTTFLLAPYSTGRIWYWHEEAMSSWYPSISIHSQDQNFEWSDAIQDIASKLKNAINK